MYVAWHDCRFRSGCSANDIVLSTSSNGTTWTAPVRIPIDAVDSGADHFLPGLAVNAATSGASTDLFLAFYSYDNAACSSSTCALEIGFGRSGDAGATWTFSGVNPPIPVSWIANTSQGRMVGDYISSSFLANGRALPIWSHAYAPTGGVFEQGMETILGGMEIPATGAVRAGGDVEVSGAARDTDPGSPVTLR
jgi:hypothetical protein